MSNNSLEAGSLYLSKDVKDLLRNKYVVFMGDSNVRSYYKDLIVLSQENRLTSNKELRAKMENYFLGDRLVYHGKQYNGRNYREERSYYSDFKMDFFYLTRVYNEYVDEAIDRFAKHNPSVLIINSCLWDVTRWGSPSDSIPAYKENMRRLMRKLKASLPKTCLVIWLTAMPVSQNMNGGFLIKELEFTKFTLRFHIAESNIYAASVMEEFDFDILDTHYLTSKLIYYRTRDGIHWFPPIVRYLQNALLRHIALAWSKPLPKPLAEIGTFSESEIFSESEDSSNEEPCKKKICASSSSRDKNPNKIKPDETYSKKQLANDKGKDSTDQFLMPNHHMQIMQPWMQPIQEPKTQNVPVWNFQGPLMNNSNLGVSARNKFSYNSSGQSTSTSQNASTGQSISSGSHFSSGRDVYFSNDRAFSSSHGFTVGCGFSNKSSKEKPTNRKIRRAPRQPRAASRSESQGYDFNNYTREDDKSRWNF